ncbi:hypothetical protein CTRI78_v012022 [Colletotrichum trifolii]|uniref:Uncharacterized protein n=1 Tax=Colletotrichum trifolii TaxID=5466 RepID=A0A4R8PVS1_COLTR|nr:hypothetical protein CTRI78_v012022 [Colletotrichum trifolii]
MALTESDNKQEAMQAISDHIDTTMATGDKDYVSEKDGNGNGPDTSEEEYAAVGKEPDAQTGLDAGSGRLNSLPLQLSRQKQYCL